MRIKVFTAGRALQNILSPDARPRMTVADSSCNRCWLCARFASDRLGDRLRLLMKGYHVAIIGATGAVGQELLRVLERRNFPVANLRPIGSARSAGKSVRFRDESIRVQELGSESFDKIDIAFFSAGGEISRKYVPLACQADAIAIDNSSVFRMEPHVPLVIPEINADDVRGHRGLIANPNCTTAVALMALYPLHRVFGVRRIFAASYQAVSGSGTRAIDELKRQTTSAVQEGADEVPAGVDAPGYSLSAPHRV